MTEFDLKKKLQEWLGIKREADALQKAREDVEKASISMPMGGGMRMSGINIGPIGESDPDKKHKKPKSTSVMVSGTMGTSGATSSGMGGASGLAASEDHKPHHEDIVAGVKTPHELKSFSGPVPYDHPHRELAAKFVTDVWRKHKGEGMRMSDKYLGEGQGLVAGTGEKQHKETYGNIKKAAMKAIPADVSEPIIENRVDSQHPKEINGPQMINAYKSEGTEATGNLMLVGDIVKALKRKKYGPS